MSEFMWVSKSEFDELKAVVYGIRSNVLNVKYHPGGVNLDGETTGSSGSSSSPSSIPAKVTGKTGIYHIVDLYGGGIDNPATSEDQKVFVLELNLAETVPVGSWIMVCLSTIGETGGGNVP